MCLWARLWGPRLNLGTPEDTLSFCSYLHLESWQRPSGTMSPRPSHLLRVAGDYCNRKESGITTEWGGSSKWTLPSAKHGDTCHSETQPCQETQMTLSLDTPDMRWMGFSLLQPSYHFLARPGALGELCRAPCWLRLQAHFCLLGHFWAGSLTSPLLYQPTHNKPSLFTPPCVPLACSVS